MKKIVIVRHAKSVPYGYDDDFNRDLRERGKNDAKLVSEELKKREVIPELIISSPAKRAIKTARIFADNLGFQRDQIQKMEAIYQGLTTREFLEIIKELPEEIESAFFFGHNPDFHNFVYNLLENFDGYMPTCSTVGIEFRVNSWKKIEARTGYAAFHLVPKMFK